MKLHDFGWWYRKDIYTELVGVVRYEYSKIYSPGFDTLLFDGIRVANNSTRLNVRWVCQRYDLLEEVFGLRLRDHVNVSPSGFSNYAFYYGYIPKPEDFEVISEAT